MDASYQFRPAELAAELGALRQQPGAIPGRLLDGLLKLVLARGPCSVLQLNRFVTEGGRVVAPAHHKQPPPPELMMAWNQHTRLAAVKMEHRVFARKGKVAVGSARLSDLFDPSEWSGSPLAALAEQADLGDMAYLWVRCSGEDLWVVCLRRRSFETPFTDRDFSALEEYGLWFGGIRQSWYAEDARVFTEQELKCVRLLAGGKSAPEAAQTLGMERKLFEQHLDSGKRKLAATSRFELLSKLLNR